MPRRALIVGGSMAGLCAGLFLRKRGWAVDIYERSSEELTSRGAGHRLASGIAGAARGCGRSHRTRNSASRSKTGASSIATATSVARFDYPQIATSWTRLLHMLGDAFPAEHYHLGKNLTAISLGAQRRRGRVWRRNEGSRRFARRRRWHPLQRARLTSCRTRSRFMRAMSAGAGSSTRAISRRTCMPTLFASMTFCLPAGEQILAYPVAGPGDDLRPGHRWVNFIWYVPAEQGTELPALLTDINGRTHSGSIPPPLIRPQVVAAMRAHAEAFVSPQFRALVSLAGQPFLQPIYDFEADRMVSGRVALIGDAAFVAPPACRGRRLQGRGRRAGARRGAGGGGRHRCGAPPIRGGPAAGRTPDGSLRPLSWSLLA